MVEIIYCGMQLDGKKLSYMDIKNILNGFTSEFTEEEVQAVLNMKAAWDFILDTIDEPLTLEYICKINQYITKSPNYDMWALRYVDIDIIGTNYRPPIPIQKEIQNKLDALSSKEWSITEKGIMYFLWGARSQLFWDGDHRTNILIANKILLEGNKGMLYIPVQSIEKFRNKLLNFYSSNDYDEISRYLYENSIYGNEILEKRKELVYER